MGDGGTLINTADDLERYLLDADWPFITQGAPGSSQTTLCLICPFCNAMIPPVPGAAGNAIAPASATPRDWRHHHIRYHVDMWRQVDHVKETSWP